MAQRLPFHSAGGTTLNTVFMCHTPFICDTSKTIFFIYTGEQGSRMLLDYKTFFLKFTLYCLLNGYVRVGLFCLNPLIFYVSYLSIALIS